MTHTYLVFGSFISTWSQTFTGLPSCSATTMLPKSSASIQTLLFTLLSYMSLLCHVVAGNVAPHSSDFSSAKNEWSPDSLELVQLLFRHGDRSPTHAYSSDIHTEGEWPQGFGQLTTRGMYQEYSMGQFLHERYVQTKFLHSSYKRAEVYVRSTNIDRTLMSAYCVLAGLFPPDPAQEWSQTLNWQPIPVHAVPLNEDYLFFTETNCPNWDDLHSKFLESDPFYLDTIKENQDLIDLISQTAPGVERSWDGLEGVLDPLFCQNQHNMSLPAWSQKGDNWRRLLHLMNVSAIIKYPRPIARLRGGYLVYQLAQNIKDKLRGISTIDKIKGKAMHEGKMFADKMYIFSAHDTTINALLQTLKIFNDINPPYSALFMMELHRDNSMQAGHYVQIFYRNDSSKPPLSLQLPGCDFKCPVDKFMQLVDDMDVEPNKLREACGIGGLGSGASASTGTSISYDLIAVLISLVIIITGIIVISQCMRKRKNKNFNYRQVPTDLEEEEQGL
ncbi:hypothetical protein CHS0354_012311 [Potamilus streckersoni]|uniref:acid phosphatase n=1 Tax=Potamilus streckersoni TaxID=2493646 RepID=A0AAE0SK66_9BIVA|nr:hypothetical protein CHS0354_012311 [Potamilus streckersoni]